nr:unnamed protein product [Naegleria fowleri]
MHSPLHRLTESTTTDSFVKNTMVLFLVVMIAVSTSANPMNNQFDHLWPIQKSSFSSTSSSSSLLQISLFNTSDSQQSSCSCPNCYCNAQTCPKTILANRFTVLVSMECSGSLTAGVGLVNIRSVDTSGIQYFLVDAANKEKALNGQPFEFSSYKSTENNQYSTCVSDGRPSFRPFANSNSAYMVVRNSNMVSTSMLEFNVQLSCVIYPATMVRMKTSFANEYFTKHYVGGPRMRDDLVSCMHVMNRRGEGFINCNTSEMIASNFEIRAMFNGVVLDTKTILLDGPVLIFSLTPLQWLFILGICIVIGVVVIGGILLVVYFMRKREKKEMVKLEDPIDNNKELELENMEQPFRNAQEN